MRQLFATFTDRIAARDSLLRRMDARSKLTVALVAIACVLFSTQPLLPLMVAVALLAAARIIGRISLGFLLRRMVAQLGLATILFVLHAFLGGTTPLPGISLFGFALAPTREGIAQGALLGARVLGAISVMRVLSMVTPAPEILNAFGWMRLPRAWVETAMLMVRYVFPLLELTSTVAAAQRARLGYVGLRRSLSSAAALSGTVFIRSMDQAIRTREAMVLRGYRGLIPTVHLPLRPADRRVIVIGSAVHLLAFLSLELWWRA
jgi:cobalt/nickel transport system permease protein